MATKKKRSYPKPKCSGCKKNGHNLRTCSAPKKK